MSKKKKNTKKSVHNSTPKSSKTTVDSTNTRAYKTPLNNGKSTAKKPCSKKESSISKGKAKTAKSSKQNVSDKIFPGNAIRSRDEFFYQGEAKDGHNNNPKEMYRKAYVIETNNLDEIALVKSTLSKGHHLISKPEAKFKPSIYIFDNNGKPIKISSKNDKNPKFIRSSIDDLTAEDVEHIRKRTYKHSDSIVKIKKLKSRKRK